MEEEDKDEKLGHSETERDNALAEIFFFFEKYSDCFLNFLIYYNNIF